MNRRRSKLMHKPRTLTLEHLGAREVFSTTMPLAIAEQEAAMSAITGGPVLANNLAAENGIVGQIVGQTSTFQALANRFGSALATTLIESVGRVESTSGTGSGTVLAAGGRHYVLTAAHVVEDDHGQQFALSQIKFRTFDASATSFGFGSSDGTTYEVEAIAGRSSFDGRDLALLKLKNAVSGAVGISLPGTQPVVGNEILTAGYGLRFASDTSRQRRFGLTRVDGVNLGAGGISDAGHWFVGEHVKYEFDSGEAATAKGDSGGPDYLVRNGEANLVGVHSFGQVAAKDSGVPSLDDETWSVQITSPVVSRIVNLIRFEPEVLLQFGVVVRNDGDGAFASVGEWHATLDVNGRQIPFDRNVTARSEPYWIDESTRPARPGERVSVRFSGTEADDGFFTGGDDEIPLFSDTVTVRPLDNTWTVGSRDGDTAYDLVARTLPGFRRSLIDGSMGTSNNVFDPRAVNGNFTSVVAGDFNADGIDDLLFHDVVTGQNRWAFGQLGGNFAFEANSRIGEAGINGEFNHVVVGDFNGDRLDDLVFHATASGNNRWFLSRPDGSYDFHHNPIGERGVNGEFDHLVVGDFNGDGADDLLFHATASGNNRWAFGVVGGLPNNLEINRLGPAMVNSEFDNVVAGDFDGDGADDVLFHASQSGNTRWAFGRRDGRFDTYSDVARPLIGQGGVNHEFNHVAAGDLNGDGRDDLVFFATGSGHTRRAYGRTDRTFEFDAEFRIEPAQIVGMQHVVLADFDGDGVDDQFFHAVRSGGTAIAFSGWPATSGRSPWVFVGDFDADGDPDVIRRQPDDSYRVELWDANGIERTVPLGAIDGRWQIVAIGDFDGDHDDDLLLRHANGNYHVKIMQHGDWPEYRSLGEIDPRWQVVAIGDFDGDGDEDVVNRLPDGSHETKLMHDGMWHERRELGAIDPAWSVQTTGDFDGDGDDDLLLHHPNGESTIKRMQDGVWQDGLAYPGWLVVAVADWDRDGDDDLLLRDGNGPLFAHLLQDGARQAYYVLPGLDATWHVIATGDSDHDGYPDVLLEHATGGRTWLGIGREVARQQVAATLGVTGDLNGDGIGDLFTFERGSGINQLRLGTSSGDLAAPQDNVIAVTAINGEFDRVVVGDFNGDGRDDLMFHALNSGANRWFLSQPDGSFEYHGDVIERPAINGEFDHVVAGDFNGDGVDDLLFHATRSGTNRWWMGSRDGFASGVETNRLEPTAVNGEFDHVVSGDFDGNGADDVLFHASESGHTRWMFGRTDDGFDTYYNLAQPLVDREGVDAVFHSLGVGDLDGDGRDDVAFYSPSTGHVRVAYGQPDQTFRFAPDFKVPREELAGADQFFANDFNGDGTTDLLFRWGDGDTTRLVRSERVTPPTPPTPPVSGPVIQVRVQAVDAVGQPITAVTEGDSFFLRIYVQDLRPDPRGVFSTYVDVTFDAGLSEVSGPIEHGEGFSNLSLGNADTPGLIDEVGGFGGLGLPIGTGELLVATIPMRAIGAGTVTFAADPADDVTHEMLLYDTTREAADESIDYGTTSLTVNPGWSNPVNAEDVNGDGNVTPLDVLLVVSQLNARGSQPVAALELAELDPMRPVDTAPERRHDYLDVNNDRTVTPLDALLIIERMNGRKDNPTRDRLLPRLNLPVAQPEFFPYDSVDESTIA